MKKLIAITALLLSVALPVKAEKYPTEEIDRLIWICKGYSELDALDPDFTYKSNIWHSRFMATYLKRGNRLQIGNDPYVLRMQKLVYQYAYYKKCDEIRDVKSS